LSVASFACPCGFRDEVREPAPASVYCPECKRSRGAVRYVPTYAPPEGAGRPVTAKEAARIIPRTV